MGSMELDVNVLGVKVTGVPYHMEVEVDDNEKPLGSPNIVLEEKVKIQCRTLAIRAKKNKLKVIAYKPM